MFSVNWRSKNHPCDVTILDETWGGVHSVDRVKRDPKKVNQSELTRVLSKRCEHSTPLLDAPSQLGCGELQNIANLSKNVKTYPKKGIPLPY